MKWICAGLMVGLASFSAGVPGVAQSAPAGSEKIVFPKEIENCEPCKRLWLANNQQTKAAATPATPAAQPAADDQDEGADSEIWSTWTAAGSEVYDDEGALVIETSKKDAGGVVLSPVIAIDPTRPLVIERRARVVAANDRVAIGLSLVFGATPDWLERPQYGMKPRGVYVTYADYGFSDAGYRPVKGVYLGTGSAESRQSTISEPGKVPWGEWFTERIEYNPALGEATLKLNDKTVGTLQVGKLPADRRYLRIYMDAYGWFTGHAQSTAWIHVNQVLY